jgi:hypothetical protein
MEITVRSAMPEEAEAIARMHVRSWQAAYRGLFPDAYLDGLDWREWAERRRADIADGDKQVRVAVDGTVVLGFASFGPTRDDDLPAGHPSCTESISIRTAGRGAWAVVCSTRCRRGR